MKYKTTFKLENYILDTKWDSFPPIVRERIKGCAIDLFGALIVGSKSNQFKVGLKLAADVFGKGTVPVVGSNEKFNFIGASAAMGHSSNAYDIDDGHNIIRAHPGAAIIAPILAAALEKGATRDEFYAAMIVGYETCIRSGQAIMKHYANPHSTGTFGPAGIVAGVARIYNYTKEELNNCLSIAEFNAPLVAGERSVEYPSMNKDGVPFGTMTGALAIKEHESGFKGNMNLLESEDYKYLTEDLGDNYEIMNLYFKPYTCCRWAHPAIDACLEIIDNNGIVADEIENVTIQTFLNATKLSKIVPATADEAQYNIAYPVAAAILYHDFGIAQVHESKIPDPAVTYMMNRLHFEENKDMTAIFPEYRLCKAVIKTKDGKAYTSRCLEPYGEASDNIGTKWLSEKFKRITGPVFTESGQEKILDMLTSKEDLNTLDIVNEVNKADYWKDF